MMRSCAVVAVEVVAQTRRCIASVVIETRGGRGSLGSSSRHGLGTGSSGATVTAIGFHVGLAAHCAYRLLALIELFEHVLEYFIALVVVFDKAFGETDQMGDVFDFVAKQPVHARLGLGF